MALKTVAEKMKSFDSQKHAASYLAWHAGKRKYNVPIKCHKEIGLDR
jgi:hypothetical protein